VFTSRAAWFSMSIELINHSADLKRLKEEGYAIEVYNGYLLIHKIPYVNEKKEVLYGILISDLKTDGTSTVKPHPHTALWAGDYPCKSDGSKMVDIVANSDKKTIRDGLVAGFTFSQKKTETGDYQDYHEKMTRYIDLLENQAHVLEQNVTAKTFALVENSEEKSVFFYMDTASSRAGITYINNKLKQDRIAIVGLGGTGAYVLDLIAKMPVEEIHLFDGDDFLSHNAFRSPGAPSVEDLKRRPTKVSWFAEKYSRMRRKIIPHCQRIDETNLSELKTMNFVFLCIDKNKPRQMIVIYLNENGIPFIDIGMGLDIVNDALTGSVRVTTHMPGSSDILRNRIPSMDGEADEYSSNIQVADLNALNAALAIIKWKKICGFYLEHEQDNHTVYATLTNIITNEKI
jgi:molybdopterin/thiamine biosynthesis adenylyltransferase